MESNTQRPKLIDPVLRETLFIKTEKENRSYTNEIIVMCKDFYYAYIKPQLNVIICLILIFCILYIRYIFVQKKKMEMPKEPQIIYTKPKEEVYYNEPENNFVGNNEDMFRKSVPLVNPNIMPLTTDGNIYYY